MSGIRHASASRPPVQSRAGLAIVAALLAVSAPHAAQLGHSRLVSQAGQPLHIEIPVADLSATEADTLHAEPARATAWQDAGLTPPVPLDSLDIQLVPGPAGAGHVLQVSSAEVFNQPVADLLLDVRYAAGEQSYQVRLLEQPAPDVVRTPAATHATEVKRLPAGSAGTIGT